MTKTENLKNKISKFNIILILLFLFAPTVTMAATFNINKAPNNLGLVGYWTFDGKDIINNIKDVSGNNNVGYLNSAGYATSSLVSIGKIGQSLKFIYGVTNYRVNISSVADNIATGDVSVSVWIKPTSVSQNSIIFHLGDTPSTNDVFLLWGNVGYASPCTTGLTFCIQAGPTIKAINSGYVTPSVNTWYHVVGTFSTTNGMVMYVDELVKAQILTRSEVVLWHLNR